MFVYSHSGIRSIEGTFTGFFFSRFTLKTGLVWRIDPFQPWEKVFRQREISNFPNCPSPVLSAHWRTSLQFEKYGAFKKHVQSLFYFIFFFEGCASKNFDTETLRGLKSPLWNPPSSLLFPAPPLFPPPPPLHHAIKKFFVYSIHKQYHIHPLLGKRHGWHRNQYFECTLKKILTSDENSFRIFTNGVFGDTNVPSPVFPGDVIQRKHRFWSTVAMMVTHDLSTLVPCDIKKR